MEALQNLLMQLRSWQSKTKMALSLSPLLPCHRGSIGFSQVPDAGCPESQLGQTTVQPEAVVLSDQQQRKIHSRNSMPNIFHAILKILQVYSNMVMLHMWPLISLRCEVLLRLADLCMSDAWGRSTDRERHDSTCQQLTQVDSTWSMCSLLREYWSLCCWPTCAGPWWCRPGRVMVGPWHRQTV